MIKKSSVEQGLGLVVLSCGKDSGRAGGEQDRESVKCVPSSLGLNLRSDQT